MSLGRAAGRPPSRGRPHDRAGGRHGRENALCSCRERGVFAAEVPMRLLALIGALAIVVALGAAVYFFGGCYSVAATEADACAGRLGFDQGARGVGRRHAPSSRPQGLNDAAAVSGGRARLRDARLHQLPRRARGGLGEVLRGATPRSAGPDEDRQDRTPAQLFWVVKNGIKMTGMPGFGANRRDDPEIWQIVAFLKKLPGVSEAGGLQVVAVRRRPRVSTPRPRRCGGRARGVAQHLQRRLVAGAVVSRDRLLDAVELDDARCAAGGPPRTPWRHCRGRESVHRRPRSPAPPSFA